MGGKLGTALVTHIRWNSEESVFKGYRLTEVFSQVSSLEEVLGGARGNSSLRKGGSCVPERDSTTNPRRDEAIIQGGVANTKLHFLSSLVQYNS